MGGRQERGHRAAFARGVVIQTPDQRLRVFVSSTIDELADERRAVSRAISALRLTPMMFELGARPHPPEELYRAHLSQSDVFIGLYWQRYGKIVPNVGLSGLEDEYQQSRGLPRLLYVKTPAPDRDPRLAELLSQIENDASYRLFRTPAELARLVRDDLATLLSERFVSNRAGAGAEPSRPWLRGPNALPAARTVLVGRDHAIDEVSGLFERPDTRLVTLTGLGGIGKTRLAIAVGERMRHRFGSSTVLVPLAAVTEPERVLAAIGLAVGADMAGTKSPLQALVERLGDDRWLLILDNLEQVIDAAGDLDELLARCPGVVILATSLTVLRLRAERGYPVPPLPLPPDPAAVPLDELASSPAVALFVDRARSARHDFALTAANARAVVEICRRLEGLPLAIELAAARARLLSPDALADRLARSLDGLGTGAVDMPERQQTLRATVEWSVGLLDDDDRAFLETVAVFVDGWTVDAAAEVAEVDEDAALAATDALAGHSLISVDLTDRGPRSRMLETVRAFLAERLAARPDARDVARRHADHYRAVVEQADRPLRGHAQRVWVERMEAEAGNLTAAVRWYLTHDRAPLPHVFRILAQFWILRDHVSEPLSSVSQLLPTAGSLDATAQAELWWTALLVYMETGDDEAALRASEHLTPLLGELDDGYVKAVSELAAAWAMPILDDYDGALSGTLRALEQFRRLDEPVWTAVALVTAGTFESTLGRRDDAQRHLSEAHDQARQVDSGWVAAWCQIELGIVATERGRLDDAWALIDEGLSTSLAFHSTSLVTICLGALARLAYAEGKAERSAMLAGAADGMRMRAGMRAWPKLRRPEDSLVEQARQALGPDGFDRAFAAGSRLSRQKALTAARDRSGDETRAVVAAA